MHRKNFSLNRKHLFSAGINLFILVCASFACTANSWSTDELEVFDAVEEIKQNLYTLLKVSQVCESWSVEKR